MFGYKTIYLGNRFRRRAFRPLDYLWKVLWSLWILSRKRRGVVWIQLPPTPLLYVAYFCSLVHRRMVFVMDCHNAMLRSPWLGWPGVIWCLNHVRGVVIVHNERVRAKALSRGINASRILVLHDLPPSTSATNDAASPEMTGGSRFDVVFPASFARDEPIDLVFHVARRLSHLRFAITGDYTRCPKELLRRVPENVCLTGWMQIEEYHQLLRSSRIILGLTSHDDVQLSAATEALGFTKPAVVSDTPTLRLLFPEAVHVEHTVESLASGIAWAVQHEESLKQRMERALSQRQSEWRTQANRLCAHLHELLVGGQEV